MSVASKNKRDCCGCNACAEICPCKCIEMKSDSTGFLYPVVDSTICIECGACEKVCPFPTENSTFKYPLHAYAARMKNASEQSGSSSGGAAFAIGRQVLKNQGVVYGCAANGLDIRHVRIDDIERLNILRGSKYVQSNVNGLFSQVKSDLKNGRSVAFIGTPCQISGLRNYLRRDYDNLLTIDLICHGTPSQKMLRDHVKSITNGADIDTISFRAGNSFIFSLKSKGCEIWKADVWSEPWKDMYYRAFMDGISYRPSCNICPFGRPERTSDITIGDFWGLKDSNLFPSGQNLGTSVILPNTEKGLRFLQPLSSEMELIERPVQEAIDGNSQLRHPVRQTKSGKIFYMLYPHIKFDKALRIAYFFSRILAKTKRAAKKCHL